MTEQSRMQLFRHALLKRTNNQELSKWAWNGIRTNRSPWDATEHYHKIGRYLMLGHAVPCAELDNPTIITYMILLTGQKRPHSSDKKYQLLWDVLGCRRGNRLTFKVQRGILGGDAIISYLCCCDNCITVLDY